MTVSKEDAPVTGVDRPPRAPRADRQFRVLFLYPNLFMMNMMPPAIAIMSALLKRMGVEVALFDSTYYDWESPQPSPGRVHSSDKRKEQTLQVRPFNLEERGVRPRTSDLLGDLEQTVDAFGPDLVAVSVVEDTYPLALYMLEPIRSRRIPTIAGGVFPTFAPEVVIGQDGIDMICLGEGEVAIVELCERMALGRDYSDVPNLWVKSPDGQVRRNPLGPLVDLDSLPMPDYDIFEANRIYRPMAGKVYRMIPIETHRGCPFGCSYCNSPAQAELHRVAGAGKFFRKKSLQRIEEELDHLIGRHRAEYIYFTADTFLAWTAAETERFGRMYERFRLPFWCQTRPETITAENADLLARIGCHRMSIGIEHGNEQFRRDIVGRRISNEELITKTNLVGERIPVSVNNITGFPTETRDLAFDTIRLNRRLVVDTMNCYNFMPYHGAPLRDLAVKLGYLDANALTCSLTAGSILEMPQYPRQEIAGIVRCFSLYVRMPESEWSRIRRAEMDDDAGNALFAELRQEYIERYFNDGRPTYG